MSALRGHFISANDRLRQKVIQRSAGDEVDPSASNAELKSYYGPA